MPRARARGERMKALCVLSCAAQSELSQRSNTIQDRRIGFLFREATRSSGDEMTPRG